MQGRKTEWSIHLPFSSEIMPTQFCDQVCEPSNSKDFQVLLLFLNQRNHVYFSVNQIFFMKFQYLKHKNGAALYDVPNLTFPHQPVGCPALLGIWGSMKHSIKTATTAFPHVRAKCQCVKTGHVRHAESQVPCWPY